MTVMNEIRAALEDHLMNMSGLPEVAFPNVKYDPKVGVPFIRTFFIPVTRRPTDIGPNPLKRYDGLYTINVCEPVGSGEGANCVLADALLTHFDAAVDIIYGGIKIGINYSEPNPSYPDGLFFCTPVVVSWYTYN